MNALVWLQNGVADKEPEAVVKSVVTELVASVPEKR